MTTSELEEKVRDLIAKDPKVTIEGSYLGVEGTCGYGLYECTYLIPLGGNFLNAALRASKIRNAKVWFPWEVPEWVTLLRRS